MADTAPTKGVWALLLENPYILGLSAVSLKYHDGNMSLTHSSLQVWEVSYSDMIKA